MTTLRTFSILAALSLAGAAYAQTQAPPDQTQSNTPSSQSPSSSSSTQTQGTTHSYGSQDTMGSQESKTQPSTDPKAASSPHQRETTKQPTGEAPPSNAPGASPDPSAASTEHQRSATHMAAAGAAGAVSTGMQVQTRSGESLGTVADVVPGSSGDTQTGYVVITGSSGGAIPVPYSAAASHVQNGKLVMDKSRLEKAPKVQQSQLQDRSNTGWQKKADSYWGKGGHERMSSGSEMGRDRSDQNRSTNPDQMPPRP